MSVSSILAFALAGVAAKNSRADRQDKKRIAELEARVTELEGDVARANIQYRRDQELIDLWRERALATPAMRAVDLQPAGPDFRPPQIALQQAAAQMQALQAQQTMLAQCNQQAAAQNFYNQCLAQNQQLGAQGLIDAELFCNCVPARHDMFLRGR